jgi:N-acetyl-anhydromuramyl-L-alanine amidase AmpD
MKKQMLIIIIVILMTMIGFNEPKEAKMVNPKRVIHTINALLPKQNSEPRKTPITNIVIHFSSNAPKNPKNPYRLQDIRNIYIRYGVSTHYLIGRKGEIYRLVPESRVAFHAGKGNLRYFPKYKDHLNLYSIGIELMAIGTKKEMDPMMSSPVYQSIKPSNIGYTKAQYQSLRRLVDDIINRNPSIKKDRKHIIGHDEYAPGRKTDPGSLFHWKEIGL